MKPPPPPPVGVSIIIGNSLRLFSTGCSIVITSPVVGFSLSTGNVILGSGSVTGVSPFSFFMNPNFFSLCFGFSIVTILIQVPLFQFVYPMILIVIYLVHHPNFQFLNLQK